jgi:UDP-2,4-diacetamido-2,4,6-trideoxy-beta-L-altropyranose hydrolase
MEINIMSHNQNTNEKKMNFVIRLDAGTPIGNGHLMRSMVLCAELLERGHNVILLTRKNPSMIEGKKRINGLTIKLIKDGSDGLLELNLISQSTIINWLIIDHYDIDAKWEKVAYGFAQNIMVIDDLANRKHECEILLDQNVPNRLQEKYESLIPKRSFKALGWAYLLARPEFYINEYRKKTGTLVFLGSSDKSKALSSLIKKLHLQTKYHPLKILVSSEYKSFENLKSIVGNFGKIYCDISNPIELYRSVRQAIVTCGFVSYEMTLIGVPTIHVYGNQIQKEVAMELEKLENGIALPEEQLSKEENLIAALDHVAMMEPEPKNKILSPGAEKIAKLLENFHESI